MDRSAPGQPVRIYGAEDFADMRRAGALAAATLDHVTGLVRAGVSTGELDRVIEAFIRTHGATPATLGYRGYPKSSCISVNHVVNHGIPSDTKRLVDGDILNIDVTVVLDGWYGDTSRMYWVGDRIAVKRRLLTDRTFEAMWAGIEAVRPGATLGDVGAAIQAVAEERRNGVRFSVVRDFVGHGVGRAFHEPPEVKHYGKAGDGLRLEPGMIFTIEPMINAGTHEVKISKHDSWTTVTRDGEPSAQFEHTVGVTEGGVEVFTASPTRLDRPPYDGHGRLDPPPLDGHGRLDPPPCDGRG